MCIQTLERGTECGDNATSNLHFSCNIPFTWERLATFVPSTNVCRKVYFKQTSCTRSFRSQSSCMHSPSVLTRLTLAFLVHPGHSVEHTNCWIPFLCVFSKVSLILQSFHQQCIQPLKYMY